MIKQAWRIWFLDSEGRKLDIVAAIFDKKDKAEKFKKRNPLTSIEEVLGIEMQGAFFVIESGPYALE